MTDVYYELYININPLIEDDVAQICFENLDCQGVVLEEQQFKELEMTKTTKGTLKVFLKSLSSPDNIGVCEFIKSKKQELLERGFSQEELGSWDCALLEKENQDWSKKWKENWDVTHITDKVVIVPSWIEYSPKAGESTVILDPGCAFGTGTHQTTRLCVIAMEQFEEYVKGKDVADIGTGSGILSVIAKKKGAKYVYGCDIDETVIDVAKENAFKNKVECIFELGSADNIKKEFDFICANILHNVLYDIMPELKRILKHQGVMVLSGILESKKDIVLESVDKNGLEILKTNYMEPWISYVVKK